MKTIEDIQNHFAVEIANTEDFYDKIEPLVAKYYPDESQGGKYHNFQIKTSSKTFDNLVAAIEDELEIEIDDSKVKGYKKLGDFLAFAYNIYLKADK